jgi:hypothetical protein
MTTPKLLLSPFFVFLSPFPIAPIFFVYDSRSGSTVAILPHDVFKVSFFFSTRTKKKERKKKFMGKKNNCTICLFFLSVGCCWMFMGNALSHEDQLFFGEQQSFSSVCSL